jgi:hypothetical protein
MGEVVNLRRARKRREREDRRAEADANAARHGEPVALRRAREAEADRAARALDGARRDGEGDGG